MFSTRSDARSAAAPRWRKWLIGALSLVAVLWLVVWLLKQREALSVRLEIEQLGGQIESQPGGPGLSTLLLGSRASERVTGITLANLQRFDATWATTFPELEWLSLYNIQLTAQDLDALEDLPRLRTLNLLQVHFDGQELRRLANLRHLEQLRLSGVSDQSLSQLAGCNQLRVLRIFSSERVTDRGLERLPRLPRLEYLQLVQTAVTPDGVEQFKRRFPNVEVHYQGE